MHFPDRIFHNCCAASFMILCTVIYHTWARINLYIWIGIKERDPRINFSILIPDKHGFERTKARIKCQDTLRNSFFVPPLSRGSMSTRTWRTCFRSLVHFVVLCHHFPVKRRRSISNGTHSQRSAHTRQNLMRRLHGLLTTSFEVYFDVVMA